MCPQRSDLQVCVLHTCIHIFKCIHPCRHKWRGKVNAGFFNCFSIHVLRQGFQLSGKHVVSEGHRVHLSCPSVLRLQLHTLFLLCSVGNSKLSSSCFYSSWITYHAISQACSMLLQLILYQAKKKKVHVSNSCSIGKRPSYLLMEVQ